MLFDCIDEETRQKLLENLKREVSLQCSRREHLSIILFDFLALFYLTIVKEIISINLKCDFPQSNTELTKSMYL